MFPSIKDKIYDNLGSYIDENMTMRRAFVKNIPYFRKCESKQIDQLLNLLKPVEFQQGTPILVQDDYHNDKIFILFSGSVQVRVRSRVEGQQKMQDKWLSSFN
jgi:signal-transduction protein with cAMP-binding, CBS, and nucleotidyltransferase domain